LTSLIANTQAQIDAIVAARPAGPVAPEMLPIPSWERISHPAPRVASLMSMRRTTLKSWIHEGTCALTQMGCKYRHEMPMDRETQLSLNLNHGLPNRYRRGRGGRCLKGRRWTEDPPKAQIAGQVPSRCVALDSRWGGYWPRSSIGPTLRQ
jgi:hypothetical protein